MSPDYAHATVSIQHLGITYNTLCLTNSVASYLYWNLTIASSVLLV